MTFYKAWLTTPEMQENAGISKTAPATQAPWAPTKTCTNMWETTAWQGWGVAAGDTKPREEMPHNSTGKLGAHRVSKTLQAARKAVRSNKVRPAHQKLLGQDRRPQNNENP